MTQRMRDYAQDVRQDGVRGPANVDITAILLCSWGGGRLPVRRPRADGSKPCAIIGRDTRGFREF